MALSQLLCILYKLHISASTLSMYLMLITTKKIYPIYLSTDVTAFAPSAAAVIICLKFLVLISPAAYTPSILVRQSSPATIYPASSIFILSSTKDVTGCMPTAKNTPSTGFSITSPVFLFLICIDDTFAPPSIFSTVLSRINSIFSVFLALFTMLFAARNSSRR